VLEPRIDFSEVEKEPLADLLARQAALAQIARVAVRASEVLGYAVQIRPPTSLCPLVEDLGNALGKRLDPLMRQGQRCGCDLTHDHAALSQDQAIAERAWHVSDDQNASP
jgi:hypothetical protein